MIYGRCVGKDEARELKRAGALQDEQGGLVPTFGLTNGLVKKLDSGNGDSIRGMFRGIGVKNPYTIVLFETPYSPAVGPIPQSNGMQEYKFNSGTPVTITSTLRL